MTTETGTGRARDDERDPSAPASDDDDDDGGTPPPPSPCWLVASTPYTGEPTARGLVASRDITRGEVVEVSHCVVLRDYPFDDNGVDKTSSSRSDGGGESKSSRRNETMGLEHYVFFDRRGRSLRDLRPRGAETGDGRDGGGSGDGGDGSGVTSRPRPPPTVRVLLALGAGSLFNHSSLPNVDWRAGTADPRGSPLVRREGERASLWGKGEKDEERERSGDGGALWPVVTFYAARDIERGEELTISYGTPWWEEEGEEEEDVDVGVDGPKGNRRQKSTEKKKRRPTHSHMDDEDAFLGAMTLGGDE